MEPVEKIGGTLFHHKGHNLHHRTHHHCNDLQQIDHRSGTGIGGGGRTDRTDDKWCLVLSAGSNVCVIQ